MLDEGNAALHLASVALGTADKQGVYVYYAVVKADRRQLC